MHCALGMPQALAGDKGDQNLAQPLRVLVRAFSGLNPLAQLQRLPLAQYESIQAHPGALLLQ